MHILLYNALDTNEFAVLGYSLSGGAVQLSAVLDSSLSAVIALNPTGDLEFLQSQTINSSLAIIQISDVIEQMYDLNIDSLTGSWRIEVSNVESVANENQNGPFQWLPTTWTII